MQDYKAMPYKCCNKFFLEGQGLEERVLDLIIRKNVNDVSLLKLQNLPESVFGPGFASYFTP